MGGYSYLFAYRPSAWFSVSSYSLMYWFGVLEDFELVLGKFPGNPWHVRWDPCKDFPVLTEEFDERAYLCDR